MSPTANNVNVNSSRDPWTYSVRKAVEDIVKNWPFETNMTNHVITQGPCRKTLRLGEGRNISDSILRRARDTFSY